ncbi:helix-turn-helix domain-containing protein [Streptomyces sp. NPDC046925]|uniref:helix-turn-helix domain-containing protein n=1 Tax=Streptomyces sp. NPDC046925 TaxID=3155375 RepID=UPI0033C02E37
MRSLEDVPDGVAALAELQQRLRDRRDARGIKMVALERLSGLGHTTVSKALNGPGIPTRATVIALARALKTDTAPLLQLWDQTAEAGRREAPQEPSTRDFFDDLIENHTRLFAGRQAERARIMEFIRERPSGYVFVEAPSGYGKTRSWRIWSGRTPSSAITSSARPTGAVVRGSIPPAPRTYWSASANSWTPPIQAGEG